MPKCCTLSCREAKQEHEQGFFFHFRHVILQEGKLHWCRLDFTKHIASHLLLYCLKSTLNAAQLSAVVASTQSPFQGIMSYSSTKIKPPAPTWKGRLLHMMVSLVRNFHCRTGKQIRNTLSVYMLIFVTYTSQAPTLASGDGVKERGAARIQALEEEQTRCAALVQERLEKTGGLLHVCEPGADHLHLVVSEHTWAAQASRNLLHHAGGHALAQGAQLTLK